MRSTGTLATLLLLASTLCATTPTTPAHAARGASCDGKKATIETSSGKVTGTEGADVIVAFGSKVIRGLGGDDRICHYGRASYVEIEAGDGNDYVNTAHTRRAVSVDLGAGDDTFVGGSARESVGSFAPEANLGADTITTRGGDDWVWADPAAGDVVALGGGDDHLSLQGSFSAGVAPDGGAGDDGLDVAQPADAPGELLLDNTVQRATLDGTVVASWDDFEAFAAWGGQSQRFVGSDEDERVHFGAEQGGVVRPSASMGAGDDTISTHEVASVEPGAFDGEAGDDLLEASWNASAEHTFTGSLGTQRIDYDSYDGPGSLAFAGMEGLAIQAAAHVTVIGDDGDNMLRAYGCVGRVEAGGGDDEVRITGFWDGDFDGCTPRSTVLGGAGSDTMLGSWGPDRLFGGAGSDVADGGRHVGPDVCRAEVERRCER